jgi:hypothetical protein
VAGGGSQASGKGDRGSATKAWLYSPSAVAVDSAGNIYIADRGNVSLREVTPDGIISTIAGGIAGGGFSGDGGPASAARLGGITGVAVDPKGNIYIADGSRVRRIAPTGVITTVAGGGSCNEQGYGDGGQATRAYLYRAQSVTVDASGNLYIPDSSNNQVRKVSSTGIISTVAGIATCRLAESQGFSGDGGPATLAKLLYPQSVTLDRARNLYIAEWGNNRIRKVDANGTIKTIAGNGEPGSVGFRRSLDMVAGNPPTAIGIRPQSIAADDTGNLFIADPANSCVWVMSQDGRMRVIAGDARSNTFGDGGPATKAILNPVGLALGKKGTIYVADASHGRIRLLTPTLNRRDTGAVVATDVEPFTIVAPSSANGNPSIEQIASQMADAIASNTKKYRNLLYNWELRAEFSGTAGYRFPTFGGSAGEKVRSAMPAFHGHFQMAGDKPISVLDGWADQPPFSGKDMNRRLLRQVPGEPPTLDIIQQLLTAPHNVKLVGIASDRGSRAYVVESLPSWSPAPAVVNAAAARCAAGLRATVFIDVATFFPIRMDAEVVSPKMCSPSGDFPLDALGTRQQVHYIKLRRKDPCGDIRELWVIDQGVQRSRINSDGYIAFPGQIAQRTWPLGPNYRGGDFKSTTINSNFQVFVTGSCLSFGEVVESRPVESVHSEIHFDLDQNIPVH